MALQPFEGYKHGACPNTRIDYNFLRSLCKISGLRDSDNAESTQEAHEVFMNSYQDLFVHHPKKTLPRIQKRIVLQSASHTRRTPSGPTSRVSGLGTPGTLENAGRPQGGAARQAQQKQSRDSLISQATKGLRKFPIHRSRQEKQAIQKMLRSFPCLTNQMSAEELPCIADISIVEAWERGHAIFANYGFYVILKGSVRPFDPDSRGTEKDPKGPVELGVGNGFGSLHPPGEDAPRGPPAVCWCVLTTEPSETLKVSHSGYAELRRELQAKSFTQKELLISSCHSYRQWPALSVHALARLLTVTRFPAKHVLVKEGDVPPFVGFIAEGECDVRRSTQGLIPSTAPADRQDRTGPNNKGVRAQTLVVGKLGAATSFGMVSVLREQPSPCSVVTATEAQVGLIQADMMRGLDIGTISLILQSTKDTYGNLTQEELSQEYVRQKKAKQLESFKIKILHEALSYKGSSPEYNPLARQDKKTHTQGQQSST